MQVINYLTSIIHYSKIAVNSQKWKPPVRTGGFHCLPAKACGALSEEL